jgi:hypothetical protein
MSQKSLLIVCCLALFAGICNAQDVITLLNGKAFDGRVTEVTPEVIRYESQRRGKVVQGEIDAYRVFSVTYGNGNTQIIYRQDTIAGNFYSVEEMQYFVQGEQDALKYYKAPEVTAAAFLLGGVGGFLLAEELFVIGVPLATAGLFSIPVVAINPKRVSNKENINKEPYRDGYKRIARGKRVMNGLKGGLAGTVAGLIIYYSTGTSGR